MIIKKNIFIIIIIIYKEISIYNLLVNNPYEVKTYYNMFLIIMIYNTINYNTFYLEFLYTSKRLISYFNFIKYLKISNILFIFTYSIDFLVFLY